MFGVMSPFSGAATVWVGAGLRVRADLVQLLLHAQATRRRRRVGSARHGRFGRGEQRRGLPGRADPARAQVLEVCGRGWRDARREHLLQDVAQLLHLQMDRISLLRVASYRTFLNGLPTAKCHQRSAGGRGVGSRTRNPRTKEDGADHGLDGAALGAVVEHLGKHEVDAAGEVRGALHLRVAAQLQQVLLIQLNVAHAAAPAVAVSLPSVRVKTCHDRQSIL